MIGVFALGTSLRAETPLPNPTIPVTLPLGHDAKIKRDASGTVLIYQDSHGEHRYKVQRPGSGKYIDQTDDGYWLYVGEGIGISFRVMPQHTVIAWNVQGEALAELLGSLPSPAAPNPEQPSPTSEHWPPVLAASADGAQIFLAAGGSVSVFRVPDRKVTARLGVPYGHVRDLHPTPDGRRIIIDWSSVTGAWTSLYEIEGGHEIAKASLMSADGHVAVTSSGPGGDFEIANTSANTHRLLPKAGKGSFGHLVQRRFPLGLNATGDTFYVVTRYGASGWSQTAESLAPLVVGDITVTVAHIAQGLAAEKALEAGDHGSLQIEAWDTKKLTRTFGVEIPAEAIVAPHIVNEAGELVVEMPDHSIVAYSAKGERTLVAASTDTKPTWIDNLAMTPDGKWLARASANDVAIYNLDSGAATHTISTVGARTPGSAQLIQVALSRDGRYVAIRDWSNQSVQVWDIFNDRIVFRSAANAVLFMPSGGRIALAFLGQNEVVLRDLVTGEQQSLDQSP